MRCLWPHLLEAGRLRWRPGQGRFLWRLGRTCSTSRGLLATFEVLPPGRRPPVILGRLPVCVSVSRCSLFRKTLVILDAGTPSQYASSPACPGPTARASGRCLCSGVFYGGTKGSGWGVCTGRWVSATHQALPESPGSAAGCRGISRAVFLVSSRPVRLESGGQEAPLGSLWWNLEGPWGPRRCGSGWGGLSRPRGIV